MPKFDSHQDKGVAALCEQCGAPGPYADSYQEAMRIPCETMQWGYRWLHHAENNHYAEMFCPACKVQFNLDFDGGAR